MKRNYSLLSFLCGCIVLTALLIQSVHSFHHLEEEFSKEKCHHDYSQSDTQLTHSHDFEHCFVCEFAYSTTIDFQTAIFRFKKMEFPKSYSFIHSKEIANYFKGSLFSLRAPPRFIV